MDKHRYLNFTRSVFEETLYSSNKLNVLKSLFIFQDAQIALQESFNLRDGPVVVTSLSQRSHIIKK